ncbi:MAG: Mitochondrial ATPase complex subunit atp10 [Watsoniomyces obsoletus]|nr:MAG: Mitochondrial ATPase complex subunit atp10 [Watsoniomyces obsoletus]
MPLRNPFRRAPATVGPETSTATDGTLAPRPAEADGESQGSMGRSSSTLSIRSSRTNDTNEYKMSVVNDSGVYLPPSPPPERTGFWGRSHSVTGTTNHRALLGENAPFSISRESFESYRRSFDISARSPVMQPMTPPRHSEDSRTRRMPSLRSSHSVSQEPTPEEPAFEDVGLNDEAKPKRRGLFSRFGDSGEAHTSSAPAGVPANQHHHHGFSFTGRRRGHSGQGAELGSIARPPSSSKTEVPVSS